MTRGAPTNNLAEVIQVLQMAHKTGTLLINRDGINNQIERGTIIYRGGQIIDATVGQYGGNEALQILYTWRNCYFTFQAPDSTNQAFTQMSPENSPAIRRRSGPLGNPGMRGSGMHSSPGLNNTVPPDTGVSKAPQRIREVTEVLPYFDRLGLTRMHRQLFLLIDGRRTVPDFILLMGHRIEEVNTLLSDLIRAGLIRW